MNSPESKPLKLNHLRPTTLQREGGKYFFGDEAVSFGSDLRRQFGMAIVDCDVLFTMYIASLYMKVPED